MALTRTQRLSNSDDIQDIFRRGKNVRGEFLGVWSMRTTSGEQKSMVVVSTKVAPSAAIRNLLRRKISERMRALVPRTVQGYHLVITVLSPHLPHPQAIQDELLSLLRKSAILDR